MVNHHLWQEQTKTRELKWNWWNQSEVSEEQTAMQEA